MSPGRGDPGNALLKFILIEHPRDTTRGGLEEVLGAHPRVRVRQYRRKPATRIVLEEVLGVHPRVQVRWYCMTEEVLGARPKE